jgi:hypothetical protein
MEPINVPDLQPRFQKDLGSPLQPQEFLTRVKHFANPGDAVAILPALKKYWEITGRKVILCQQVGQLAQYYAGAVHPTVNESGQNVCCNQAMFDMLKPLVESQPYIHSMEKYEGQKIDLDFDVIRGKTFVGMPNLMLQSWVSFAFPDLAYDYSKPWVTLDGECPPQVLEQVKGKAIINFTERYRNPVIDYFFLKNYAPELIFAGTEKEHWLFCNAWQLNIPRLEVKDFLEYAYAIKASRFFLGGQSLGWNIAQSVGHPRIAELCNYAPNVQPGVGEDSYGFFHQTGVEYYFRVLYNKSAGK